MNFRKTLLSAAVLSAIGGTSAFAPDSASAAVLADGVYNVFVNTTPIQTFSDGSGGTFTTYQFGTDGAWNSNFTYGGSAPGFTSQSFTDNGVLVDPGDGNGPRGTSIAGDGWAGVWQISVTGSNLGFLSFSEDAVIGTPFGTIVQYGTLTGSGSIDQTTGQMTITPTGRLNTPGAFPGLADIARDIDDVDCDTSGCTTNGNTAWTPLTTLSASAPNYGNPDTTINGAPVTSLGDLDGDGLPDYSAILVSGGQYGSAWGGGTGTPYFEVYNVRIEAVSAVPAPPAVWLFGTGLVALVRVASRRKHR
jgi:hypothetical protein